MLDHPSAHLQQVKLFVRLYVVNKVELNEHKAHVCSVTNTQLLVNVVKHHKHHVTVIHTHQKRKQIKI